MKRTQTLRRGCVCGRGALRVHSQVIAGLQAPHAGRCEEAEASDSRPRGRPRVLHVRGRCEWGAEPTRPPGDLEFTRLPGTFHLRIKSFVRHICRVRTCSYLHVSPSHCPVQCSLQLIQHPPQRRLLMVYWWPAAQQRPPKTRYRYSTHLAYHLAGFCTH